MVPVATIITGVIIIIIIIITGPFQQGLLLQAST
jgi:hypothetical protein